MPRWTARLFRPINTVLAQKSNRTDAAQEGLLDRWEESQKGSRGVDRDKYHWRHLIKNFIAKPSNPRGIATLYDQRDCAFLGDTHRVAAVIWLN